MFKDEKGNVSLIAALSLSVLVPVVGFAIDAQRQMSVRQDVEASLDATVLMAARDRASESQARGLPPLGDPVSMLVHGGF